MVKKERRRGLLSPAISPEAVADVTASSAAPMWGKQAERSSTAAEIRHSQRGAAATVPRVWSSEVARACRRREEERVREGDSEGDREGGLEAGKSERGREGGR